MTLQIKRAKHLLTLAMYFKCLYCSKKFKSKSLLKSHANLQKCKIHGRRVHVCPKTDCNRIWFDLAKLRRHIQTHEKLRAFACDICSKAFKCADTLARHKRFVHDWPKSASSKFRCDECRRVFKHKFSLQHHIAKHAALDSPDLVCALCEAEFTRRSALVRHVTRHSGRRASKKARASGAVVCDECSKEFKFPTALRRHIASVHATPDAVRFQCAHCSLSYKRKDNLSKHRRRAHPSAISESGPSNLSKGGKAVKSRSKKPVALQKEQVNSIQTPASQGLVEKSSQTEQATSQAPSHKISKYELLYQQEIEPTITQIPNAFVGEYASDFAPPYNATAPPVAHVQHPKTFQTAATDLSYHYRSPQDLTNPYLDLTRADPTNNSTSYVACTVALPYTREPYTTFPPAFNHSPPYNPQSGVTYAQMVSSSASLPGFCQLVGSLGDENMTDLLNSDAAPRDFSVQRTAAVQQYCTQSLHSAQDLSIAR